MGEKSPTVSVVIPTYNRGHLIGRSIKSVLNQTYQDFEIIVIDDASTDNTEELIFSLGNGRIRYVRHEKNKGCAAARNTGIKVARGEFIAFQDSDDEWLPEKLEKQMKVFETAPKNVGVVYTGFYRITGNEKTYVPYSWVSKKDGDIHQELLTGNFVGSPTIIARAGYLKKIGLVDEKIPHFEDWDLVLRLSKNYGFKCVDEPLLISYFTTQSMSANQDAIIKATQIILEKHFDDFKKKKRLIANHYLDIGFKLRSSGDFKNMRDYFIKSLKAYPFNRRLLLHVLLSSVGERLYNKVLKDYRHLRSR
jgi:glycosyltransferase involved in cell wall biosynthesis